MDIIELFAGCGGLAKGMAQAGFTERALIEFNADACCTLSQNFDPSIVHLADVRDFDYSPYRGVDAISGGPPCQPFSFGGLSKANNDARDMFPEAARAIAEVQPRGFLFENVRGLLRKGFAEYFSYIVNRLRFPLETLAEGERWQDHNQRLAVLDFNAYTRVKYRVQYHLVNAADYGVPQKRERVVIVGIRNDVKGDWHLPKPLFDSGNWRTIADELGTLPEPTNPPDPKYPDHVLRPGAQAYHGHSGSDINKPSKTIKAGAHGVPGGENVLSFPDGSRRYMTVYEAKRIQTFPPDFRVLGSWSEAMRQIGNAVPVRLATILGRELFRVLDEDCKSRQTNN